MMSVEQIADKADMIVNGYAFLCDNDKVHVINLERTNCALLMDKSGNILETTMCEVESQIVVDYWNVNKDCLEEM